MADQWQNRIEIKSETSGRIYVVSQNVKSGKWGCSCPGYRTRRKCKHLTACGLTAGQIHGGGGFMDGYKTHEAAERGTTGEWAAKFATVRPASAPRTAAPVRVAVARRFDFGDDSGGESA